VTNFDASPPGLIRSPQDAVHSRPAFPSAGERARITD
jgi:hypothetical protein